MPLPEGAEPLRSKEARDDLAAATPSVRAARHGRQQPIVTGLQAMSGGKARRVPIAVEATRFASGLSLVYPDARPNPHAALPGQRSITFDLIRPVDLLAISVEALGCELFGGDDPVLRAAKGEEGALLIFRFGFQNIGEQAFFEGARSFRPDPQRPDQAPQVEVLSSEGLAYPRLAVRAAGPSRLVFALPPDETVPFSTEGLLAAMARLVPVLHSRAEPGDAPTGQSRLDGYRHIDAFDLELAGGLIGRIAGNRIKVGAMTSRQARERGIVTNESALAQVQSDARATRNARLLLHANPVRLHPSATAPEGSWEPLTIGLSPSNAVEVSPLFGESGLIAEFRRRERYRKGSSRPPTPFETAIEAPYRLILSPGSEGCWVHALRPVRAPGGEATELWHTRLATLVGSGADARSEERDASRRIVRAVWTRDRDGLAPDQWQDPQKPGPDPASGPFRMSLDPADRHMLVRQTSETTATREGQIGPRPLAASLWLSSLGAWNRLSGSWDTVPYSLAQIRSILSLDYRAALGRDQHAEVAYPGFLHPFGHQAVLVKVTDRKIRTATAAIAGLYQRMFLVVGEPVRNFGTRRDFPFTRVEIEPRVTPAIDDPMGAAAAYFFPKVGGQAFAFDVHALDHDMRPVRLKMPLLWVAASHPKMNEVDDFYDQSAHRVVPSHGQQIAFAPNPPKRRVTLYPAERIRFTGKAAPRGSEPAMAGADVLVPAVEQLAPTGPLPITYHPLYKASGFDPLKNRAEIWAEIAPGPDGVSTLRFGTGGAATEKTGGFLAPSMPLRGLSRTTGVMGSDNSDAAAQTFDPLAYFGGTKAKLFGLVPLSELAVRVESDVTKIPALVSQTLSRIEALGSDIAGAADRLAEAVGEAKRLVEDAQTKAPEVLAAAKQALEDAEKLKTGVGDIGTKLEDALSKVKVEGRTGGAETLVDQLKQEIDTTIKELEDLANRMPVVIGNVLRALAELLRTTAQGTVALIEDIYRYVNGIAQSGNLARVSFSWTPELSSWPDKDHPVLRVKRDSLVLAVVGQVGMSGKNEIYASAQLSDFSLHLFGKAELVRLQFDRFGFKSGGGKPEVDVVFRQLSFHGVLSFVDDIRRVIPLDGFSDPPMVDISPEGLKAGFRLDLPDIAVGMFSITNMSLNADVQVPFFGKAMTFGFSFCTRERPFTVSVAFIGGGGWCGIRLSAEGLEVLEVGIEAGACIAVNFGVASGSVSAMLGIYIRLEGDAGTIAGYFRLRGEVDVLGLISASIELYMALLYHTETGKLIGEARITVNVSVIGFSKSVEIYTRRTFKGSNADPHFRDVMLVQPDGTSAAWSRYCAAFAPESL